MKALTICQPYASMSFWGGKRVENRTWETLYRGPLLIHAGKSRAWLVGDEHAQRLVFGAILGRAALIDVLHIREIDRGAYDSRYPWLREHPHTHGPFCWVFGRITAFAAPIPWRGAQGLFNVPDSALGVAIS